MGDKRRLGRHKTVGRRQSVKTQGGRGAVDVDVSATIDVLKVGVSLAANGRPLRIRRSGNGIRGVCYSWASESGGRKM